MPIAYLALGSNLGNREGYLNAAIEALKVKKVIINKVSSFIETDPVGGPVQGKFLNAVLEVTIDHAPEQLHQITQSIEIQLGRIKRVYHGPRVIDIDILLYEDVKLITPDLLIPHPRMFERPFVMKPLKEIAPELCASFLQSHK